MRGVLLALAGVVAVTGAHEGYKRHPRGETVESAYRRLFDVPAKQEVVGRSGWKHFNGVLIWGFPPGMIELDEYVVRDVRNPNAGRKIKLGRAYHEVVGDGSRALELNPEDVARLKGRPDRIRRLAEEQGELSPEDVAWLTESPEAAKVRREKRRQTERARRMR